MFRLTNSIQATMRVLFFIFSLYMFEPVPTGKRLQCFYPTMLDENFGNILRTISNTRDSVSSRYPSNQESWKYDAQRSIFNKIRGVWKCDQTLSRGFDISSQSKLKLRRKQIYKIAKIYDWMPLIRYQNPVLIPLF